MSRKKENVYWELVRRFREFEDGPIDEEPLGLYCSKQRALNEKDLYLETEAHEVEGEETISLVIRKLRETIEEVDLISVDELDSLATMFETDTYV